MDFDYTMGHPMNAYIFISTQHRGLARAECQDDQQWQVENFLTDKVVCCLATDPHNPQRVYAGTQGDGIWHSGDAGKTWQPAGLAGRVVKSIAVSTIEEGTIYAGLKPPEVHVSRNYAADWVELEAFREKRRFFWFTPAEPGAPYVQAIALSPTDPDIIVAGVEFGAVLRSEDGGKSWKGHLKGAIRDCHSLSFHATNGNWVYEAGASSVGAALSRDGGITWSQPKEGLDRHYGWACAADPARPEVWYVSASPSFHFPNIFEMPLAHIDGKADSYIFRSTGGAPWKKLAGGLPQPLNYMPYALLTHPNAPGHLYAGLSNGDVWHTADYGDTWQQLAFNLGSVSRSMVML